MSSHSINNQNLQNYPKIQIDRASLIKSCVANHETTGLFCNKPAPLWKKIIHELWHGGFILILRFISSLQVSSNSNICLKYMIKVVKYVASLILHLHSAYLYIYEYFYPYSLMTLDEVCNEFSRCPKWTESVIRAFAWHPNHDRCALATCNDFVLVYEGATRIRALRHNRQRKIVDLAWQPTNKDVLVVATQTDIILWRIAVGQSNTSVIRDGASSIYLAPGPLHVINRRTESQQNGLTTSESFNSQANNISSTSPNSERNFLIIPNILYPPIISIKFHDSGSRLYACSPNSSSIAILDINKLFNNVQDNHKQDRGIEYLKKFGPGITRLLWSPEQNRLATATTSSFVRVFEPFRWTCNRWLTQGSIIQDLAWSKPTGRMLLIATKNDPHLYALPFLDSPQPNDVGGNKSLLKALNLNPVKTELGDIVGGLVQSFAWDKNGKRLAVSFKDNPESILLYRTVEIPTVEFHQMGVIQSDNGSLPLFIEFHDKFKEGSLLTICWSDGNIQHIPLTYDPQVSESNMLQENPRSLTSFCHVSGNNSISLNLQKTKALTKRDPFTVRTRLSDAQ